MDMNSNTSEALLEAAIAEAIAAGVAPWDTEQIESDFHHRRGWAYDIPATAR